MKIAHDDKTSEKGALQNLLSNYRNTPHPATGISPSSMLFRDGQRSAFPRVKVSNEAVQQARSRDLASKQKRQSEINSGKYKSDSKFLVGEHVLIRNYHRERKFDPLFLPDDFVVMEVANDGLLLTLKNVSTGAQLKRHPDEVKRFSGVHNNTETPHYTSEREILQQYLQKFTQLTNEMEDSYESFKFQSTNPGAQPQTNNTRITRSAGLSLSWNPAMNAGNTVVAAKGNNEQLT